MLDFLFEALFQWLGELLLQLLFEAVAEVLSHSLINTLEKHRHPVFSTIGFIMWGLMAGGVSLLIFPHSLIRHSGLRTANLVVTPVVAGAMMMLIGRLRSGKGQDLVKIDRFGYAYVFALTMSLIRFAFAR